MFPESVWFVVRSLVDQVDVSGQDESPLTPKFGQSLPGTGLFSLRQNFIGSSVLGTGPSGPLLEDIKPLGLNRIRSIGP